MKRKREHTVYGGKNGNSRRLLQERANHKARLYREWLKRSFKQRPFTRRSWHESIWMAIIEGMHQWQVPLFEHFFDNVIIVTQCSLLILNGRKYYLKYTFKVVHVLATLHLGTPLEMILLWSCIWRPRKSLQGIDMGSNELGNYQKITKSASTFSRFCNAQGWMRLVYCFLSSE